jgi:hypothetical protein
MWAEVTAAEYGQRIQAAGVVHVGSTISDPDGSRFGFPHMLTEWLDNADQPIARHQCWPIGHTAGHSRPCLYEVRRP